jgi:ribosomal protein S21
VLKAAIYIVEFHCEVSKVFKEVKAKEFVPKLTLYRKEKSVVIHYWKAGKVETAC